MRCPEVLRCRCEDRRRCDLHGNRHRTGGALWIGSRLLQYNAVRRLPNTFGWLAERGIPAAIPDCYAFISEDQPAELTRLIVDFAS
jgi:hypothetical protein